MTTRAEWTIADEIRALIWFTRVVPLLMILVIGALYLRVAYTPITIAPTPDFATTQGAP